MQPNAITKLSNAFLVILVAIVILFSFPINFIAWGVYNRKEVNPILSVILVILSLILMSLQINFYSYVEASILKNWFFVGPMISFPFFMMRATPSRILAIKWKWYLTIVITIIMSAFYLLVPPMAIHYFDYKSPRPLLSLTHLISLEATACLWISLVIFLFIKYPNDPLARLQERFDLNGLIFR